MFEKVSQFKFISPQLVLNIDRCVTRLYDPDEKDNFVIAMLQLPKEECAKINLNVDNHLPLHMLATISHSSKGIYSDKLSMQELYNNMLSDEFVAEFLNRENDDFDIFNTGYNMLYDPWKTGNTISFSHGTVILKMICVLLYDFESYCLDLSYDFNDDGIEGVSKLLKEMNEKFPEKWGLLNRLEMFKTLKNTPIPNRMETYDVLNQPKDVDLTWTHKDMPVPTLLLEQHNLATKLGYDMFDQDDSNAYKDLMEF